MGTTEKHLSELILEAGSSVVWDETIKEFEQSIIAFEELVSKGYASHRGYNIQTFGEQIMSTSYSNLHSLSTR